MENVIKIKVSQLNKFIQQLNNFYSIKKFNRQKKISKNVLEYSSEEFSGDDGEDLSDDQDDSKTILEYGKWYMEKYCWEDGTWYKGDSLENIDIYGKKIEIPHGKGIYVIDKKKDIIKTLYMGMFKNGMFNGYGLYIDDGTMYIGNWKNDYQQGIGTSFNENKDRMISYWKEGAKNGWTVVYYPKRKFGHKGYTCYYREGIILFYGKLLF